METFHVEGELYDKIMSFVCHGPIPTCWEQPFVFKEHTNLLRQWQGGPCGILAAIQAHILKILTHCADLQPTALLCNALLDIMHLIRPCFVFCTLLDIPNRKIEWQSTCDRNTALKFLEESDFLTKPNAVVMFTVSLAILVGPIWLSHFSIPDTFITEDAQTNLTLVILMISGEILDSYHDGNMVAGGIVFKGALGEQRIGIVSIAETQAYQKLGQRFQKPTDKIWLGYYGGHFTAIIGKAGGLFELDQLSPAHAFVPVTDVHPFWRHLYAAMK
jgi:hypothetical protein